MTYCGELISNNNFPPNLESQINEIYYIFDTMDVNSNDMLLRNTCCLGDELKIIDFSFNNQFGKTINETLEDFISELSKIRKINCNLSINQNIIDNDKKNEKLYTQYYPNWQQKIENYKKNKELILKKQLEYIQYRKKVISGKIKLK